MCEMEVRVEMEMEMEMKAEESPMDEGDMENK